MERAGHSRAEQDDVGTLATLFRFKSQFPKTLLVSEGYLLRTPKTAPFSVT